MLTVNTDAQTLFNNSYDVPGDAILQPSDRTRNKLTVHVREREAEANTTQREQDVARRRKSWMP